MDCIYTVHIVFVTSNLITSKFKKVDRRKKSNLSYVFVDLHTFIQSLSEMRVRGKNDTAPSLIADPNCWRNTTLLFVFILSSWGILNFPLWSTWRRRGLLYREKKRTEMLPAVGSILSGWWSVCWLLFSHAETYSHDWTLLSEGPTSLLQLAPTFHSDVLIDLTETDLQFYSFI